MRLGFSTFGLTQQTGGGVSSPYLDGVVSGVVAQYSGLYAESADGTGNTFVNLLGNTDWDLTATPISTTNVTWDSLKKRWIANHDGCFEFTNGAPALLQNAHRNTSGGPITIVYHGYNNGLDNGGIIGGPVEDGGLKGLSVSWQFSPGLDPQRIRVNDGVNSVYFSVAKYESVFFILTIDPTKTVDNVKLWYNSRTPQTASLSFNTDDAATADFWVWAWDNGSGLPAGTVNAGQELQELAILNRFITQTDADAIINYYQALTGEACVLDDEGDPADVTYLVVNMRNNASTSSWYIHDFAVRDTDGNDLLPSLADFGAVDRNVTCVNELDADGQYGAFANFANLDLIRLWNDAAWDDGGNPVANTRVNRFTDSTAKSHIRVVMRFPSSVSIGSVLYYIDDATTRVPDAVEIYSQDGVLTAVSGPTEVYSDGGDKRGYQIVLQS